MFQTTNQYVYVTNSTQGSDQKTPWISPRLPAVKHPRDHRVGPGEELHLDWTVQNGRAPWFFRGMAMGKW